ncbi:MAG: pyroglutamyl-peptidase I [Pseudolabrys sp.]
MPTILLTGFGPFPGAPFNPTGPLVQKLARLRRPSLADVKIIAHVFPTSYTAVDRELPKLMARHKPDGLLMFGLAPRARILRIETRARNSVMLLPDATGAALPRHSIVSGGPRTIILAAPARQLLAAARTARVPAALSRDAGRYLCNYLCWRAAETVAKPGGPKLAAFVHVPMIGRKPRLSADGLARAGARLIMVIAATARR